MRKTLLVAALALAFASSAQAAVTFDPGTSLTVECAEKRPFLGEPFSAPSSTTSERTRTRKRTRFVLYHQVDPTHIYVDAAVRILRKRAGVYRIRTQGVEPVSWPGC